jgi:DNA-binding beta-propeller fold protein YncE
VLFCPSSDGDQPASYVVDEAAVAIGNFAIGSAVQPLDDGTLRLFVTVRGDPSVTWIDFDPAAQNLECGGSGGFPRCDEAHRLDQVRNDSSLGLLPTEPFYVAVDPARESVFVTHIDPGAPQITLVHAPADGREPIISDVLAGVFSPGPDGFFGTTGVASRLPGDELGFVYVASRKEYRVVMLRVGEGAEQADGTPTDELLLVQSLFLNSVPFGGASGDVRGVAFSEDGNLAVFVTRCGGSGGGGCPPQLLIYDTSIGATGLPKNEWLGTIEVCSNPALVSLADFGDGLTAYVPCFSTGQVWSLDIERQALVAITDSGGGPQAIAGAKDRGFVYVANYAEDTVSVIDARPGSPTQHRTVLRLGKRRED